MKRIVFALLAALLLSLPVAAASATPAADATMACADPNVRDCLVVVEFIVKVLIDDVDRAICTVIGILGGSC